MLLSTTRRGALLAMSLMATLSAFFSSKARSGGGVVAITSTSPDVLVELSEQASLGRAFVRRYVGEKASYTGVEIDEAIVAWRSSADPAKESAELVVERVGAFFGACLNDKLALEWAVYRDARGNDLCVVHKSSSVFGFPHSAIYKAAVQGRAGALAGVEAALAGQLAEAAKDQRVMSR